VFAWCENGQARAIVSAMAAAFARHGLEASVHVAPAGDDGARIVDRG
jgi:hypothetical protein